VAREFASPDLANLIAARLPLDEFERRVRTPLTDTETQDLDELMTWFSRRYPTAGERLAYARGKLRQYARSAGAATGADYRTTAARLARAHWQNDPGTIHVFLDPDREEKQIRLLEVTRSAPTLDDPLAVELMARPDLGVLFPSAIVLLSPDEWEGVQVGRLLLPAGWGEMPLEPLGRDQGHAT
jgi:hypothetical protein